MTTIRPSFTNDLIAQLCTSLGSAQTPETPAEVAPAPLTRPSEARKEERTQKGQGICPLMLVHHGYFPN